jgi:tRNA(Ile2) C34 agmatinyltransferase TiaS
MNPLRWRKMTWVLNLWNLVFLIWIIAGISDRASKNCAPGDELCINASDAGTGIGVAVIILLWFLGFIVLALVWLMTRRRGRICPHCGEDVKKGRTACQKCGYDFTIGGKPPSEAAEA